MQQRPAIDDLIAESKRLREELINMTGKLKRFSKELTDESLRCGEDGG